MKDGFADGSLHKSKLCDWSNKDCCLIESLQGHSLVTHYSSLSIMQCNMSALIDHTQINYTKGSSVPGRHTNLIPRHGTKNRYYSSLCAWKLLRQDFLTQSGANDVIQDQMSQFTLITRSLSCGLWVLCSFNSSALAHNVCSHSLSVQYRIYRPLVTNPDKALVDMVLLTSYPLRPLTLYSLDTRAAL